MSDKTKEAQQRLKAFCVQHSMRSLSWDGHMLTGVSHEGTLMSALDIDHSSAMRPMWLHLEQWLQSNQIASFDVSR